MPSDVEARLKNVFATVFDLPEEQVVRSLSPDTCMKWDSLYHIHLMSAIEETFGIVLTFEQQIEIMTFDLAIDVVNEALAQDEAS